MHRAALARGAAVDLAVELGEHCPQVAALADVMGVRAVRADDVVFEAQVPAYARGHGLLADAEMGRAAHIALRVERLDALLDAPDPEHRAIERDANVARRHRRLLAIDAADRRQGTR